MNADLKAKWIAALRSGDYRQGRNYLSHGGNYCCLGVLCEVAGIPYETTADSTRVYSFGYDMRGVGILRGQLEFQVGQRHCAKLAELNDSGESFDYIADYIRTSVEATQ